jgi:hypothetical protein
MKIVPCRSLQNLSQLISYLIVRYEETYVTILQEVFLMKVWTLFTAVNCMMMRMDDKLHFSIMSIEM